MEQVGYSITGQWEYVNGYYHYFDSDGNEKIQDYGYTSTSEDPIKFSPNQDSSKQPYIEQKAYLGKEFSFQSAPKFLTVDLAYLQIKSDDEEWRMTSFKIEMHLKMTKLDNTYNEKRFTLYQINDEETSIQLPYTYTDTNHWLYNLQDIYKQGVIEVIITANFTHPTVFNETSDSPIPFPEFEVKYLYTIWR